jgi:acetyl-CoA C-acetyltransferase
MRNGAREVVLLSGVRTAIGRYGGSLKDTPPTELAATVVREAVKRAGVEPGDVGHVVFGNVIHTDAHDMYLSRVAAIKAGLPVETPALTVNRLCGSGLQAIVSAAQTLMLGDADVAVAGALTDPFDDCHMGITAENVARTWQISRADQDALAAESHRRAAHAVASGYFAEQIVPVAIKTRTGPTLFVTDEHARADADVSAMATLRPVFDPHGTVTAGNASGINDAAAAVVLMERAAAERRGLQPRAGLVAYAHAGVEPRYMGIGPVPAVRTVLARAGLGVADLDVIEVNEAFAAQALAVVRELGLPADRTNPNGSGISLGHPIGATGAILTVKALYELERTGGRYALVTMCIGGGQGIAAILERL